MLTLSRTLPLLLGIGLAAIAGSAGLASSNNDALLCGLTEQTHNGMRSIIATVVGPSAIEGQYHLSMKTVRSGNSSTVNQGGPFAIRAHEPATIGQLQIDAKARYSIEFSITVDGHTMDCSENGALAT